MTDFGVYCSEIFLAGAPSASSDMFAAVLSKAVDERLEGFSQPEETVAEHNKRDLLALFATNSTAGAYCHSAVQPLFALLTPIVLLRVAFS